MLTINCIEKTKINKKRPGMAHFFKKNSLAIKYSGNRTFWQSNSFLRPLLAHLAASKNVRAANSDNQKNWTIFSLNVQFSFWHSVPCRHFYIRRGILIILAFSFSVWYGVIFIRQGIYQEGIFRFKVFIPDNYPDGDCPVSSCLKRF